MNHKTENKSGSQSGGSGFLARSIAVVGLLALLGACAGPHGKGPKDGAASGAGVQKRTMVVDGVEREYYLRVPSTLKGNKGTALLFVLHGGGARAVGASQNAKFHNLSDRSGGVILVFPNGWNDNWNVGELQQKAVKWKKLGNDLEFISMLIDSLEKEFSISNRRVYSTGISAGGMMSLRLACDLSNKVAGVAAVAANLPPDVAQSCNPSNPVSVLIMNGTSDPLMPYRGGKVGGEGQDNLPVLSAENTAKLFAEKDHCKRPDASRMLADRDPSDGTKVKLTQYSGCQSNTDVSLYTIEQGGHTWPGSPAGTFKPLGNTTQDIDGESVIWNFFKLP